MPVEGDPFAAAKQYASGLPEPGTTFPVGQGLPDAPVQTGPMLERIAKGIPEAVGIEVAKGVQGAKDMFTAPGDVLAGRLTPDDPRFADSAIGLGAAMTQGGIGEAAPGEAVFGSFNAPYSWRWRKPDALATPGSKMASFRLENPDGSMGDQYKVYAEPTEDGKSAELSFLDSANRFDLTGAAPGAAPKIFATAMDVARKYVDANPDLQNLTFAAKADEPSRVRLYRVMAGRFSKSFSESNERLYDRNTGEPIDFVKFSIPLPGRGIPSSE